MQAYYNNPAIKAQCIAVMQAHYDADEITQGVWWENGKGCFLGCAIKSPSKSWYEDHAKLTNTPLALQPLIEKIFEGLTPKDAKEWPLQFYNAIDVGSDTSQVVDRFLMWLVSSDGVQRFAKKKTAKEICQTVHDLYHRRLNGDEPTQQEWAAAEAAAAAEEAAVAWVAAAAAGWANAEAAARAAARAAAAAEGAAVAAVAAAAEGAAVAAGWANVRAAKQNFYAEMLDKLLELFKSAPMPTES